MLGDEKISWIIFQLERRGPFVLAALVAGLLFYFRVPIIAREEAREIDFSNLYSAVFDWSAIQTGFLFGIFGYVSGKATGFIKSVEDTSEMGLFVRYQKTAMALGFIVTFCCIPLMVTGFEVSSGKFSYYIFLTWAFVSVWAFFSFARVAYIFGILIRPKDQKKFLG